MRMIWHRFVAGAMLLAGGVCAAFVSSAKADDEPIRTVSWDHAQVKVGSPFEVECERGSYLAGFEGRAGAWIDNLRIVCARWDAARGKLEPPAVFEGKQIGWSQGGEPTREKCPIGEGITGVYVQRYSRDDSAYVLHTIEFHCVGAVNGTRPLWRKFGSTSPIDTGWKDHKPDDGCPEGYLATGIYGRSGEFVDRFFGWVCRRRPVPFPDVDTKVSDAAKAKSYNSKWAVGGTRRIGNDVVMGGVDVVAGGNSPPPPQPTVAMAETTSDTDVYRKTGNGNFVRTDNDPDHFLPKGFVAPVLAKEGGWWLLELKTIPFAPGGEGWVAADQLKTK